MKRCISISLAAIFLAYSGLCAVLYWYQRDLLYAPPPGGPRVALEMRVVRDSPDHVMASVVPRTGVAAVIYFGGNGEDVSVSSTLLSTAFPNHAIYLLHYRGFAPSTGRPFEAALFADALALFDLVHRDHARVTVIGSSLGTGVAVRVAGARMVERLVLVTPYDSLAELYAAKLPIFPIRWILRDKFESWRHAPDVKAPTLILVAGDDEMIPFENSNRLALSFKAGVAKTIIVPGTTHNSIYSSADYPHLLACGSKTACQHAHGSN